MSGESRLPACPPPSRSPTAQPTNRTRDAAARDGSPVAGSGLPLQPRRVTLEHATLSAVQGCRPIRLLRSATPWRSASRTDTHKRRRWCLCTRIPIRYRRTVPDSRSRDRVGSVNASSGRRSSPDTVANRRSPMRSSRAYTGRVVPCRGTAPALSARPPVRSACGGDRSTSRVSFGVVRFVGGRERPAGPRRLTTTVSGTPRLRRPEPTGFPRRRGSRDRPSRRLHITHLAWSGKTQSSSQPRTARYQGRHLSVFRNC
jgi:hypothetical protein